MSRACSDALLPSCGGCNTFANMWIVFVGSFICTKHGQCDLECKEPNAGEDYFMREFVSTAVLWEGLGVNQCPTCMVLCSHVIMHQGMKACGEVEE